MGETTRENYKPTPGTSLKERREAQQEENFITRAVNFAKTEGRSWEGFCKRFPQYAILPSADKLKDTYDRMLRQAASDRFTGRETLSLDKELETVREQRRQFYQQQIDYQNYQEHRDQLLQCAFNRLPWSEVRRQIDTLGPDDEGLYRRARAEVGNASAADRPDERENAFMEGFWSD